MLPTRTPLDTPATTPASPGTQQSFSRSSLPFKKGNTDTETSSVSLSVNYLPSKFSNTLLTAGPRKRKAGKGSGEEPRVPKMGGGIEVFRSSEARMPSQNDEDFDGVSGGLFSGNTSPRKLRWNKFKWCLFVANCLVNFKILSPPPPPTLKILTSILVIGICPCSTHLRPPDMVQRLETCRRRTRRKQN